MKFEGKTPSGGDYSEIYYLDNCDHAVDKRGTTMCMIRECKNRDVVK